MAWLGKQDIQMLLKIQWAAKIGFKGSKNAALTQKNRGRKENLLQRILHLNKMAIDGNPRMHCDKPSEPKKHLKIAVFKIAYSE